MNNNNNIGWLFRLITDYIALAKENAALVFDSCSIFLGLGVIVCYQPQTIQYYIITGFKGHSEVMQVNQRSNCSRMPYGYQTRYKEPLTRV